MPTFNIEVKEKNKRVDGKFPVSIRLTHKREHAYISTGVYASRGQINPDFLSLKDTTLNRTLLNEIHTYEKMLIEGLGVNLRQYRAKELVNYINMQKENLNGAGIDFIAFSNRYIATLEKRGQDGYAESLKATIRSLTDYFGRSSVSVKEINVENLSDYMVYMQSPRTVHRVDRNGNAVEMKKNGVKPQTLKDYMGDIKTLFNAACEKYNGEYMEFGIITHNPFMSKKLQIKVRTEPKKRSLPTGDIVKIINTEEVPGRRMQLARDVLALSFYLVAMNTADLFDEDAKLVDGRLEYRRRKTRSRRSDEAIMSVKVEPEALPLINKYRDPEGKRLFNFYKSYSTFKDFNKHVNIGCKQLAEHLNIEVDLTSYYIRHSWATIASQECRFNDGEVAVALNHVGAEDSFEANRNRRVTRSYITRRFNIVDEVNRKVIDFVKNYK